MPLTKTRRNEGDETTIGEEIYLGLDENEEEAEASLDYELAFGLPQKAVRLVMEDDFHARITFDNGEDKRFDIRPFHKKTITIHNNGEGFLLDGIEGSLDLSLDTVYFESIPI